MQGKSIRSRYDELASARRGPLARARKAATLTIPSLLPPSAANDHTTLPAPFQGLGARGVNNLASKLTLTLLPPGTSFFRMRMAPDVVDALDVPASEVEEGLATFEAAVLSDLEGTNARSVSFEVFRQLIVAGNCLLHQLPDGSLQAHRLDSYVVRRDGAGNPLEVILKEVLDKETIDEALRIKCGCDKESDEPIEVYTRISLNGDRWEVIQEINGQPLEEQKGWYRMDELPWLALRWSAISGQHYGRGLVEEHLGDLISLEGLSKAILKGAIAAAKVIFLRDPNGLTQKKTIVAAESCDVVDGRASDITVLQVQKFADFSVALQKSNAIEQRLSAVFILQSAVQRSAERVTAEEIRYMAGELEDALGGVYSVLSQEFQLPLVRLALARLVRAGKLPRLPSGSVKPTITTGLEALGRGHELNKIVAFINTLLQQLGPELVNEYIDVSELIARYAVSQGIDTKGLVRTAEEVAQQRQVQAMQQALQSAAPGVIENAFTGGQNATA